MARLRTRSIFYGWWVVLASALLNLYGSGTYYYGFSVFFKPMSEEFGWSRAATAGAFSLARLEGGPLGPVVGWIIDRRGPRVIMLFGTLLLGAGFIAVAFVSSLWSFYLVYIALMSLGFTSGFPTATMAAVNNWFVRRRARAMSLFTLGGGLGGSILVPLMGWLVVTHGWRTTAILAGLGTWILCFPLALLVRHKPEHHGLLPDGGPAAAPDPEAGPRSEQHTVPAESTMTASQALRSRPFWMLTLASSVAGIGGSAVIVHQVAYLTDVGIAPQLAATALGLVTLVSLPGRLVFGWLADLVPKRYVLAAAYLLQGAGVFALSRVSSMQDVYLYMVLYGVGYGGSIPVGFAIRGEYFGRAAFATIGGFAALFSTVTTVAGPFFAGLVYDLTGSYQIAFMSFVATYCIGGFLILLATPPRPSPVSEAEPATAAP